MASNNTGAVCTDGPYFQKMVSYSRFATYSVMYPTYFALCPPAHILLLLAFYKQWKTESTYMYQVANAIGTTCEMLSHLAFLGTHNWLAGVGDSVGVIWFRRSYPLMIYASHIAAPMYNTFFCCSMFLALSMCVDRIFAMAKPLVYKGINKWRHQAVAFGFSFGISFSISFYDAFRFVLIDQGEMYLLAFNTAFMSSTLATILTNIRNATYAIGILSLIVCNVILIRLFQKRAAKAKDLIGLTQIEILKRKQERTLLFLSVLQAFTVAIKLSAASVSFTLMYTLPEFLSCEKIYRSLVSGTEELLDMVELYLVFILSRRCRRMIRKLFTKSPVIGTTDR